MLGHEGRWGGSRGEQGWRDNEEEPEKGKQIRLVCVGWCGGRKKKTMCVYVCVDSV